ncbi:MAG: DUF763 domain-containing protein [Candidatus Njordarchaeales archaeon]
MRRVATFDLPLHGGKAPQWLIIRMKKLGKAITEIIIEEFGPKELLKRLSDPLWFQALSYVLGYDWNSSGTTTVLTGVLREILEPNMGILVAGGKGKRALDTPADITRIGEIFSFSSSRVNELIRASRLAAKVDNALVQDNHSIYHHAMFIAKDGTWAIVQQGMSVELKSARRYHWISEGLKSFVVDPHSGISGSVKLPFILNLASKDSIEAQKISVDLVKEGVKNIRRDLQKISRATLGIRDITLYFSNGGARENISRSISEVNIRILPMKVNWQALEKAYELQPKDYEELISIRGIGPGTLRALALIAELIYDARVCWRDPLRYTFAMGGKDGVPYPVNVKRMEKVAGFLEDIIRDLRIGNSEKVKLLKRLSKLIPR